MSETSSEVRRLLDAWSGGNAEALDALMPLVIDELRRIAHSLFRREPVKHTLQPTAVVNEVYIKLKGQRQVRFRSRAEFFSASAHWIRRILVDHARRRRAQKRGGDQTSITIDENLLPIEERSADLIALDDALEALAKLDARQSRIVEQRIFGGLGTEEIAEIEGISRTTVWREWKTALPFLRREIQQGQDTRETDGRDSLQREPAVQH